MMLATVYSVTAARVSKVQKSRAMGTNRLDVTCTADQSDAMKSHWLAVSIICAALAALPCESGAVDCGDVIAGPVSVRLDRDLSCSGATALTVRDGAALNLGRHLVRCTAGGIGIAVTGAASRLADGEVTGCQVGVALSGNGHAVANVRSRFNGLGFRADGGVGGLRLRDNHAEFNHDTGVRVVGDGNIVAGNVIFGNGGVAVALHGDRNVLSENRANGNCLAVSCAGAYVVGGKSNQVSRNLATGEQTGIVLLSDATSTTVSRNRIRHGFDGGILVDQGATGNVLRGNVVQSFGTDLVDANGNCSANTWAGNTFETSSPGCLE